MMLIPGWLVGVATFPGVIVHEAAHFLFCRLRRVAVFDVCYLRFGDPLGYVIHEPPADFLSTFLICIGPLIINTVLCFLICMPAVVPFKVFDKADPVDFLLMWIGVSIGSHAFPSHQDANNLWASAGQAAKRGNVLAILSFPLVILIHVAKVLSIFWFDVVYGVAVGLGLPLILLKYVA